MTARTDLRTKRRRAKRQREWEANNPPHIRVVTRPVEHWPAHYFESYLPAAQPEAPRG